MKKFAYIITGLLFLTATSCKKERICPNKTEDRSENTAVKTKEFDDNNSSNPFSKAGSEYTITTVTIDTTYTITDPNRDEDDDRKIKRK